MRAPVSFSSREFKFTLALIFPARISPLNSVNLVANTMLAPACLGETLTRTDVIATLLIMIGCTITVLFGSHASETVPSYIHFLRGELLVHEQSCELAPNCFYLPNV